MKRTLLITVLCVFTILACMLSLSSCFGEDVCQHEYEDVYDSDCNVCGEKRDVAFKVIGAELSADGKKIIVKYDGAPDGTFDNTQYCGHENALEKIAVVKEHYLNDAGELVDGTYIFNCTACNSYTSNTEKADMNHKKVEGSSEFADATCKDPATETYECEYCGPVVVKTGEALGCDYGNTLHYEDGKNPCEDGRLAYTVCKRCKELNETPVVIKPDEEGLDGIHTVAEWVLTQAPTEDAEGLLTGACTICGKEDITCIIPAVVYGGEDYEIVAKDGSCEKKPADCTLKIEGAENYTYKLSAEDETASKKLTFTIDIAIKKHTVTVDGNKVEIDLDGEYDPDMKNGDNNVFTPSINTVLQCKDGAVSSTFVCDECKGVYNVNVRKVHNYDYVLNYTVIDGVYTYSMVGTCKNDDCDDEVEYSHEDIANSVVVSTTLKATCIAYGTEKHAIALGAAYETEQAEAFFNITLDPTPHRVENFSFFAGETYSKSSIRALAPSIANCDEFYGFVCNAEENNYEFTITCDDCRAVGGYKIFVHVDHFIGEIINDTASCTDGGEITYECIGSCGKVITEITPAKGHSGVVYTGFTLKDEATSLYTVTVSCANCEGFTEDHILTYSEEKSTKSTCKDYGYDVYVTEDGTEIKIQLPLITTHVFKGVVIDKITIYDISDFEGVETQDDPITCTSSVYAKYACDVCNKIGSFKVVKHTYDSSEENNVFLPDTQRLARKCTVVGCGYVKMISNVTKSVIDPACEVDGAIIYKSGEEEIVRIAIAALGHDTGIFDLNDNDKNVTAIIPIYCTGDIAYNAGQYTCELCGGTVRCSVYASHAPKEDAEVTPIIEATCTTSGIGIKKCAYCPEEYPLDGKYVEVIAPLGHSYEFILEAAPTADTTGKAIGTCTVEDCGATYEKVLPVVNADNYTADNTVIETVLESSCTETGIDGYTYTFSAEDKDYSVYFEVETPVYGEYIEGVSSTYTYVVNEEVTFDHPFDGEITITVDVTYTFYICDNEDCTEFTIIDKSFEHDGNTYIYDFENGVYNIVTAKI